MWIGKLASQPGLVVALCGSACSLVIAGGIEAAVVGFFFSYVAYEMAVRLPSGESRLSQLALALLTSAVMIGLLMTGDVSFPVASITAVVAIMLGGGVGMRERSSRLLKK